MTQPLILVVEDDRDIRETLMMVLETEGYDVQPAEHGADALERIRQLNGRPYLLLLDLMMPVMDGATLLKRLDAEPELKANCLEIVVISAAGSAELTRLNVKKVIRKPIDLDLLLPILADHFEPANL